MKTLHNFKHIVEEEKSDYSKFDALVRAGLANKAQLQRIHKILDKMGEERPVFNNADRMILQNLFNKMVDLLSNNKQIFQQTRRAVQEESVDEVQQSINTHRFKIGDELNEDCQLIEADEVHGDLPFTLVLRRKAIRLYPNDTKIALYYNDKIKKYFTIPYSTDKSIDANIQAEQIEEAVMDQLHKIVANKQAQSVKFGNGKTRKVDGYTASALTQVHGALNDDNKKKFADMVHKSPEHFAKASGFAFKHVK
jgi:hypothetical protein